MVKERIDMHPAASFRKGKGKGMELTGKEKKKGKGMKRK